MANVAWISFHHRCFLGKICHSLRGTHGKWCWELQSKCTVTGCHQLYQKNSPDKREVVIQDPMLLCTSHRLIIKALWRSHNLGLIFLDPTTPQNRDIRSGKVMRRRLNNVSWAVPRAFITSVMNFDWFDASRPLWLFLSQLTAQKYSWSWHDDRARGSPVRRRCLAAPRGPAVLSHRARSSGGGCSPSAGCRNSYVQSERLVSVSNGKLILFPLS